MFVSLYTILALEKYAGYANRYISMNAMTRIKTLLVLTLLFTTWPSIADWIDRSGNKLPDTPSRKAIGDFGAYLILTNKEKEAFKNWNTPSAGVDLSAIDKIKRNNFLSALVVFSGCAADKDGNCNLIVKFQIMQPDGGVYADLPIQEAWVDKPAPGNSLQMSIGYIKVRIEDDEPLGEYEVLSDVIDRNSGKTISLSSKFEATE